MNFAKCENHYLMPLPHKHFRQHLSTETLNCYLSTGQYYIMFLNETLFILICLLTPCITSIDIFWLIFLKYGRKADYVYMYNCSKIIKYTIKIMCVKTDNSPNDGFEHTK